MAKKFAKLTRDAVAALPSGKRITEHGIIAEKTASGDVIYRIATMVDGVRISRSVGKASAGATRAQAEQMLETYRVRAKEDRLDLPKGRKLAIGFGEGAIAYLEKLRMEGGRGIERKSVHLTGRLDRAFGSKRLDRITESDIRGYAHGRRQDGAKPGTVNRELAALSHFFKSSARWGWIGRDKIPAINRLTEGAGRIVALSAEQCRDLIEAASNDQDSDLLLFVSICLQTSMRHGEARRLRWENYDRNRQRLYIPEAKSGDREQPVTTALATILNDRMKSLGVSQGYVFKGGPGSKTGYRHTFRKAFQRAVIAAGLDPLLITPHTLRHTAITKLVKAGVDLPTVQRVSGHKTLSMVLRYAHVDGIHIDKAIEHLSL